MLSGKYSDTFKNATHALPDGMHMNADYPFMLPKIVRKDSSQVTLQGHGGAEVTAPIRRRNGREFCFIEQKSTFERIYNRKPTRFKCFPFIDEKTANKSLDHDGKKPPQAS